MVVSFKRFQGMSRKKRFCGTMGKAVFLSICICNALILFWITVFSVRRTNIYAFKKIKKNHISHFKTKAMQICYWQNLFQDIVNVLIYKLKYMGSKDMIDNKFLIGLQIKTDAINLTTSIFLRKCKL